MKKLAIIFLLIAILASPAQARVIEHVKFIITDVNPKVLEPGYRGPLNVTVRNIGVREGYRRGIQNKRRNTNRC
jgi:hypothetical protein